MSVTTTKQSQVVPFPMPWGGAPNVAGCCPPGGDMSRLMQCYCDIQQATAFITAIMIDAINNNPAVAEAIIAAIEKSGSNLPLIGVINGTDAQPGQVGEFVYFSQAVPFTAAPQVQTVNFGVLQPGDWDYWVYGTATVFVNDIFVAMPILPPGFNDPLWTTDGTPTGITQATVVSGTGRALTTVPSLIAFTLQTNQAEAGPTAGTMDMSFRARRRR